MYCSGGEPYFTINGWVYTPYFMTTRDRNKCDGFDEMGGETVESDGTVWKTDEYGDRAYMWEYR